MSDDIFEQRRVWPNEAQPRWPVFAPNQPPVPPLATSLSKVDTVIASLDGAGAAPMSLDRFTSFIKDGRTGGQVHVGQPDGTVRTASFALLRSFFYGSPKHAVPAASAPAGHP